jgi:hypothetical protein
MMTSVEVVLPSYVTMPGMKKGASWIFNSSQEKSWVVDCGTE